mgnify:FL=1
MINIFFLTYDPNHIASFEQHIGFGAQQVPITYSFKVLQAIEKRVGAKLVPEMMENVTPKEQYELLEMSRISGFVDRARGTGRPTKKDRRSMDEFMAPEYFPEDDFDFDFDFEEEE